MDRREAAERLREAVLYEDFTSGERLNAICRAVMEPERGWTHEACEELRAELLDLLEWGCGDARRYMRLPVDADGEPIWPGDELCYFQEGMRLHVYAVNASGVFYVHEGNDAPSMLLPHATRHVRPSVERLLADALEEHGRGADADEIVKRYADRIKEAAGNED